MDYSRAVESLAKMITFKTVSVRNNPEANKTEFAAFRNYLRQRYPNVFAHSTYEEIGNSGLLFTIKGGGGSAPSVLMAHYDVVEEGGTWQKPPFDGVIKDDVLWGRGTLDTKVTLCGILEAAEQLLGQGFTPKSDLYLAFSGDEEIMGPSAPAIVDVLEQRGIRPSLVVDEGGAIVSNMFPGVKQQCAVIGIAEKGSADFMLTATSKSGHASAPPKVTAVGAVAKAVCRVEAHPFKQRLIPPVRSMLSYLGSRSENGAVRLLFTNLWLTAPLVKLICRISGGELAAMTRTTCAFTMASGSKQANVLPKTASATANFRILQGDTVESTIRRIQKLAGEEITVTKVYASEPSKISLMDSRYDLLAETIRESWPDTLVTPYLMMACSDSRHFCRISDHVYRFTPLHLSKEARGLIHSENERISITMIDECEAFYSRLIQRL
ncbi:M20/M25/M40 family metallo-hydrolase [Acetanaerobacterium elongatum]|uniref:Carboxypeptidase PM20D1 n=1 Tax=Acetanaerobacterium elongatum TaxID=258515 RepID=A0A1H0DYX6_9FIRM|nr:M20/M25/M40 family metallo-hydrolase [Acetanaerobacterium elongatum]SDN75457.1 carboxypeptidase PM20D1 [Acetanaerobacterium elongatum]